MTTNKIKQFLLSSLVAAGSFNICGCNCFLQETSTINEGKSACPAETIASLKKGDLLNGVLKDFEADSLMTQIEVVQNSSSRRQFMVCALEDKNKFVVFSTNSEKPLNYYEILLVLIDGKSQRPLRLEKTEITQPK